MNERIKQLCEQAKEYAHEHTKDFTGNEPVVWMDYYTEKFAELLIKETRLKAIEEVRQAVKWADWPITSLSIVEKACEELSLRS